MKKFNLAALAMLLLAFTGWHYNLTEAMQIAQKEHKHILLNFSGSDWCGPCIRMRKEVFASEAFLKMADTSLVMVDADFPRMKKNRLSQKQQTVNESMADQYNSKGKFPFTLLLDAGGRVLKEWDGYTGMGPEIFRDQVLQAIDADNSRK
jgi:thioredoxin-related protein